LPRGIGKSQIKLIKLKRSLLQIALAGAIYAGFSLYLYQPYFGNFGRWQYLFVLNAFVASLGCFLLSRRWVSGFPGSFFAGAVYGFGPFVLGLSKFHPTAGFLAAIIPWLFCPAAFVGRTRWRWVGLSLLVLPFLAHFRLFAMPVQISLHPEDVGGLLAPLVAVTRQLTPLGFYHVPIAALIMGFSMLLAARRFGILAIIAIGTALAFCKSFLGVSPIIWLTLPTMCGAVIIGAGTQALLSAGPTDKKWVLGGAAALAALSVVMLLLATKCFRIFAGLADRVAELFVSTAYMYILGTIALTIIFMIARARVRLQWLRQVLLGSAMAVDVFFGAQFIVDTIL
jgi:hypothetical protein